MPGRLEQLLGKTWAKKALEQGWYDTREQVEGKLEVYYTEQKDTRVKEVELTKELKGGAKVEVEQAKKAMHKCLTAGFNKVVMCNNMLPCIHLRKGAYVNPGQGMLQLKFIQICTNLKKAMSSMPANGKPSHQ